MSLGNTKKVETHAFDFEQHNREAKASLDLGIVSAKRNPWKSLMDRIFWHIFRAHKTGQASSKLFKAETKVIEQLSRLAGRADAALRLGANSPDTNTWTACKKQAYDELIAVSGKARKAHDRLCDLYSALADHTGELGSYTEARAFALAPKCRAAK